MIDLQLLGGLDVTSPDLSPHARARRRHPLILLALVASAAPQPLSRDRIMAFLWPESDAARASNSLRQVLHSLRRDLGDDVFLPESSGGIQLDPRAVRVDLWAFRDAIARRAFDEAVASRRGPFLDGFQLSGIPEFSRWVEAERARVEQDYLVALDALARDAEEGERLDEAVAWRRRQATGDPFSSRAALGLLKALAAAGDRPGALSYATVYENFLRTHLEVAPDPAVMSYVAALRDESDRRITPSRTQMPAPGPETSPTSSRDSGDALAARPRFVAGSRWMIAAGIALVSFFAISTGYSMIASRTAGDPMIILASGADVTANRDTTNQLVECRGPACPVGRLPQPAYTLQAHVAYTNPATGSRYIGATSDATTRTRAYPCCSLAVFERRFTLPPDVTTASISITVLADNQAIVAINGREFGRQADSLSQDNFAGQPTTFATTFTPDPSGMNRLRVSLWDGGGAGGLNYRAHVTFNRGRRPDSGPGTSPLTVR
jgi:DNA-binding SARP family transcriptional activator